MNRVYFLNSNQENSSIKAAWLVSSVCMSFCRWFLSGGGESFELSMCGAGIVMTFAPAMSAL